MRTSKPFVKDYADQVLLASSSSSTTSDDRDTALVDLCLHYLAVHLPNERVDIVPSILQGHLTNLVPVPSRLAASILRHLASAFCSRLAWRTALATHQDQSSRTLYAVTDGCPKARRPLGDPGYRLMEDTLCTSPPYDRRSVQFATKGHWTSTTRWGVATVAYEVPEIDQPSTAQLQLRSRSVNPPIQVKWCDLLQTASEVDEREKSADFPKWLQRLQLRSRLERVSVEATDSGFFQDGKLTLSDTQHLVGMLSSGKSTLLLALLFLLVRPGYDKKVVVVANDTAAASLLVARLRAHGITKSTVLSSRRNREEHLSAAHWAVSGFESDQKLLAAAAVTESLGIACPLEGLQRPDRDVVAQADLSDRQGTVPSLADKPCHSLDAIGGQRSNGTRTKNVLDQRTCPLITVCPVHSQQLALPDANVVVITPQALLSMTPDKSIVPEYLSFPELFQYTADVVLIDEADSVQQIFDEQCLQEASLLAAETGAFLPEHQRLIANSLQDRVGGQYAKAATVRWQAAFTRLQSAVAMAYHLVLRFQQDLKWITGSGTFTAASILCDLWSSSRSEEASRRASFEQIAILASSLYSDVAEEPEAGQTPDALTIPELQTAYAFLKRLQRELLDRGTDIDDDGPLARIEAAIESGALHAFSSMPSGKEGYKNKVPADAKARSRAIGLSLLTNVVLSTFGYLVRNQPAVEDDFKLSSDNIFSTARRLMRHYGALIPRPLYGTVFGLLFEQNGEKVEGGALKLVNHLGVGRYLLTNFHRLLLNEGQAGPHVLLLSGTSWAGGAAKDASPHYDVQSPVVAVLRQPDAELLALQHSRYEFVSLGPTPISVSGQPPHARRDNLRKIAELFGQINPAGTRIEQQWKILEQDWTAHPLSGRRKALFVVSNYSDARIVANALARAANGHHVVYCLVPDSVAKAAGFAHEQAKEAEAFGQGLVLLPRSRVETFGEAPEGAVLIAPIGPISRGHNIVTSEGRAAISTIYFLHRPHPRPDDIRSIVGAVNRFTMDWINQTGEMKSITKASRDFENNARRALDDGFALRRAFSVMSKKARTQYSWDLITQLWQTIGRGIRGGVPVYVGFIDERFAPQTFAGDGNAETEATSCLVACIQTLDTAIRNPDSKELVSRLYQPFLTGLRQLFPHSQKRR